METNQEQAVASPQQPRQNGAARPAASEVSQEPWVDSLLLTARNLEECVQHYSQLTKMTPEQLANHLFLHLPDGDGEFSIYQLPSLDGQLTKIVDVVLRRELRRRMTKLLLDLGELQQFVSPDLPGGEGGQR